MKYLISHILEIKNFLKQNWLYVAIAVICNIILFSQYLTLHNSSGTHIDRLTVLFIILGIAILFLSRYPFFVFGTFIVIQQLIYNHISEVWGIKTLGARIEVAIEAPFHEAFEYLLENASLTYFSSIIFAILSFAMVAFLSLKKINRPKQIIIPSLILTIIIPILIFKSDRLYSYPETAIPYEINKSFERINLLNFRAKLDTDNFKTQLECNNKYDNVVIVIGESENRDKMSLYNKKIKENSPFLESLNAVVFKGIAPANLTRWAVPILLSPATSTNFGLYFTGPSLVRQLKRCGYRTHWISNQAQVGFHDSYISAMAKEANQTIFINKDKIFSSDKTQYDEQLVKNLNSQSSAKLNAYFIHLMGSHRRYSDRYPGGNNKELNILEHYQNTVKYTDKVLNEIYNKFDKNKLLFAYVSDHGEMLDLKRWGHGFNPAFKPEYRAPMLVWSSNIHNELRDRIKNAPINNGSFYNLIEYLVGITKEPHLSYDLRVMVVTSGNIADYNNLTNNWEERKVNHVFNPNYKEFSFDKNSEH